jgi:hypothetical protein
MDSVLGKFAGKRVGAAAGAAAGVAGATTGFVGGMISPVIQFFNDIIKQRVAAADEATKKREARDDKIVAICEAIWEEPIVTQRLVVEKEVARAPRASAPPGPEEGPASAPRPEGAPGADQPKGNAPLQIQNSRRPAEGTPLQIQNSPASSEKLALRTRDE